jgi:hypothetical protein
MTERERELESARRTLFNQVRNPQGYQRLSEIRQELRAVDAEMERLKRFGRHGSPFGSPF